jgi:hypothetical protein
MGNLGNEERTGTREGKGNAHWLRIGITVVKSIINILCQFIGVFICYA